MGSASQACDLLKSGKTWTIKTPTRVVGTAGAKGETHPTQRIWVDIEACSIKRTCTTSMLGPPTLQIFRPIYGPADLPGHLSNKCYCNAIYVVRDAKLHRGSIT